MPFVFILGGANGAGKTTYYDTAVAEKIIDAFIPYLNVDVVAKKELGSHSPQNILIAEELVRTRMMQLIQNRDSFIIESNLAKAAVYDWLEQLIKKGYDLNLDFFGYRRH